LECGVRVRAWISVDYGTAMQKYSQVRLSALAFLLFSIPILGHAADSRRPGNPQRKANPSQRLGSADGWTAYTYQEKSGRVCYVAGAPQKSEPSRARRGKPLAMVTHRPGEKAANVVNFVEGYALREGSDVSVDIGGTKFDLFTKGDGAWARTAELDKTIVEAMAKGKQAVVAGTPQKGPMTTDTYSLAGFAQALAMIDKACEIKR
jgi:hypothetical protein